MERLSRGFALFMNWFDGICAPVFGLWMMASALWALPLSWNEMLPVEVIAPLPIPGFMKADSLVTALFCGSYNGLIVFCFSSLMYMWII